MLRLDSYASILILPLSQPEFILAFSLAQFFRTNAINDPDCVYFCLAH